MKNCSNKYAEEKDESITTTVRKLGEMRLPQLAEVTGIRYGTCRARVIELHVAGKVRIVRKVERGAVHFYVAPVDAVATKTPEAN